MNLISEGQEYLDRMREHTECCGVPIVKKLVRRLSLMRHFIDHKGDCPAYPDNKDKCTCGFDGLWNEMASE